MISVTSVRLPNIAVGTPFELELPVPTNILRVGIEPATGAPVVWYTFFPSHPTEKRRFVVVAHTLGDTAKVEWDGRRRPPTARGSWWAAALTFHLFELYPEGTT